jgi:hypothetical protein
MLSYGVSKVYYTTTGILAFQEIVTAWDTMTSQKTTKRLTKEYRKIKVSLQTLFNYTYDIQIGHKKAFTHP